MLYDVGIFTHKCTEPGCKYRVQFDDEPKCFKHSPDSGSSVHGWSAKAYCKEQAKTLANEGHARAEIAEILGLPSIDIVDELLNDLAREWVYATSKNSGPTMTGTDPVYLLYLGKDISKAEDAVGDFVRYEKDEERFPKEYLDLYTALPRGMEFELIKYYMADGWWYSIVRFKL